MKRSNKAHTIAVLLARCAVLAQTVAWATVPNSTESSTDPCRAEVLKFEQAMALIRQSQGTQAAAALKEKLLPAQLETDLLLREGYCGLAKHLRDKKLSR